jgi:hypothetical protein
VVKNFVGQVIADLLVLEQEMRRRPRNRGVRYGLVVQCTQCERKFTCRADSLLGGTVSCAICHPRGTLPS